MSNDEYQQNQFWDKLEKPNIRYLTIDQIIEQYLLTEEQIKQLKNGKRKNNK
jgi:hypothetical protein